MCNYMVSCILLFAFIIVFPCHPQYSIQTFIPFLGRDPPVEIHYTSIQSEHSQAHVVCNLEDVH